MSSHANKLSWWMCVAYLMLLFWKRASPLITVGLPHGEKHQKSAFCGMLQNYASNVGPAGPHIRRSPVYGLPEVGGGGSCKPWLRLYVILRIYFHSSQCEWAEALTSWSCHQYLILGFGTDKEEIISTNFLVELTGPILSPTLRLHCHIVFLLGDGIQLKLREVTCTLEAVVLICGQGLSTMYYQCQVLFFRRLLGCWSILLMTPSDTNIYYKRKVKLPWLENHCSRDGACRKGELAFLLIDSYLFSTLVWVDRLPYMMSKDTHQLYDLWFPSGSQSVDFLFGI